MSELAASFAETESSCATLGLTVNRYWWHVNKGGFPIQRDTWEKMWSYVVATHPEGNRVAMKIRGKVHRKIPISPLPSFAYPAQDCLLKIQQYMQELQYNYTGTQFFDIKKNRPLSRLMENARQIIAESLPIKCLEAVVLALYMTSSLTHIQRFSISFKSFLNGHTHRHVVLGIFSQAHYGALGMSRRSDLMYRPLEYKTLADLLLDFIDCYRHYGHEVQKVSLSHHIVHDTASGELIPWKHFSFKVQELSDEDIRKALDKAARILRS